MLLSLDFCLHVVLYICTILRVYLWDKGSEVWKCFSSVAMGAWWGGGGDWVVF